MRLLIINSSPRRDGNISKLIKRAAETASKAGVDASVVNLSEKDIRTCTGCMICRSKKKCVIDDDISSIADAIKSADRIVIGAPCYWGNMPGSLKTMFDRLVYIFISQGKGLMPIPLLKGKKALLIAASTTPMPWSRLFGQTSGTVKSIAKIMKMGGIKIDGTLQIGDTMRHCVDDGDMKRLDVKVAKLLK